MKQTESLFISIIMPVYNRQDTVEDAVQSILKQTYSNFELIIIDDCSIDHTLQVVQEIEDQRIRCLTHKQNLGAAAARNTGIKEAKAEWIAFQDSDDNWAPDKLEKQVKAAMNSQSSSLIYTSFIRHKDGIEEYIPGEDGRQKQGYIHKELLLGNFISTQTVLVHRNCLESEGFFAEDMPRFQDWELWLRLSTKYPFIWIDEPLVDVFYTEGSISSNQGKIVIAYEKIWEKHKQLFMDAGLEYVSSFLFSYGHNLCLAGKVKKGRTIFKQAIKKYKKSSKLLFAYMCTFLGNNFYKMVYSYYKR